MGKATRNILPGLFHTKGYGIYKMQKKGQSARGKLTRRISGRTKGK